jgi:hypothetical protein
MLPAASPTVIFKELADGAVLFAPAEEIYFGLNEVGSRIWRLLPPATESLDELCAKVGAHYPDVPIATIRQDATELLNELVQSGLAQYPAAAVPNGRTSAPRDS